MRNISLFVEDTVHEDFLVALVHRIANTYNIEINLKVSSVRGGHENVIAELGQYQQDLQHNDEDLPDLIIVGTDTNSKGFLQREKEIHQAISSLADRVISMIPKPYIERWLLLDSEAFKKVFGTDCSIPIGNTTVIITSVCSYKRSGMQAWFHSWVVSSIWQTLSML